jgi:hypothetical protein
MLGGPQHELDLAGQLRRRLDAAVRVAIPRVEIRFIEQTRYGRCVHASNLVPMPRSRSHSLVTLAAAALATACGLVRRATHAVTPQPDPPATTRWNATLWPPGDTAGDTTAGARGTAWMAPGSSNDQNIRVRVVLHPLAPGGVGTYVWRVHTGKCDNDLGVFGPPSAYRPLTIDSSGHASGTALIPLGFPTSGGYFVRVDQADSTPAVIACGNLVPPH